MFQIEGITVYAQAQRKDTVQSILVIAREAVLVTAEDATEGCVPDEEGWKQTRTKGFLCLVRNCGFQRAGLAQKLNKQGDNIHP